jgi:type IV pilus assembly protein PilC
MFTQVMKTGLRLIWIALLITALLLFIAALFAYPQESLFFGGLLAIACWGWALVSVSANRTRMLAILGYIEQTVRLNLPLPRMMQVIGQSQRGGLKKQLNAATLSLERGDTLAVALTSISQMPPKILNLIAQAERVGRLPQVLGRLMQQRRSAIALRDHSFSFYRTYIPIVCITAALISWILMVFVVPKFEQIFRDFGVPMPRLTLALIGTARRFGVILIAPLIIFLILAIINNTVARWGGRKFGFTESAVDWIINRLPIFEQMRMHYALSEVFAFTAESIDAGQSIDSALSQAAQIPANSTLRKKIARWTDAMSRGQSLSDSARTARMPALVSGMLKTALDTPAAAEGFRFLGRYYGARFSRAMIMLRASAVPVFAIVMGVVVGIVALSVFLPMIRLLDAVQPYKWNPR